MPSRPTAPHVQAAIARAAQPKSAPPSPPRAALAPHVQAAVAQAAQPKLAPSPPSSPALAPHVQAAIGVAQAKAAPSSTAPPPLASHVQAAIGAVQRKTAASGSPAAGLGTAPHIQAALSGGGPAKPPGPAGAGTVLQPSRTVRSGGRKHWKDRRKNQIVRDKVARVDKKRRTRASTKLKKNLEKLKTENRLTFDELVRDSLRETPPRKLSLSGFAIYSAKWRGFSSDFEEEWWSLQPTPWVCAICKKGIDPNASGGDGPSIDHKKDFATMKLEVETLEVCKDGLHWEVALTKDVKAIIEDSSNLQPTHGRCNSSKNGSKNTDSIAPRKLGKCPGRDCDCSVAE